MKLQALDAHKISALSPSFYEVGGIKIPYFDVSGKAIPFYRVRYMEDLPGFAGAIDRPQRYTQPPKTGVKPYFTPGLPWSEISQDESRAVAITEGEFKAASACLLTSMPCIGLGGVYSFRSAREGKPLLTELEAFNWEGRPVYIVFDNDIAHKVEVVRAQRALSQTLHARGAIVHLMELPEGPAKGLDDYLVAAPDPDEAIQTLVSEAKPFGESEALWGFNERLVYVREINAVLERETAMLMKPDVFMRHTYANEYLTEQVVKKGKGKNAKPIVTLEKSPAAKRWMEWEKRAEVKDLCYEPGQGHIQDRYNTWKGWGCEPKRGDMKPWHDLMDYLFQSDEASKKWFMRWLAYPLQHPGAKLYTACLLWSRAKRVGKSIIGIAMKYIYGDNATTINSKQLKGNFNTWAKNRQFIIGEEITAGEARVESDFLKTLVTQQFITIDEKFKPIYSIRDCMQHLYFSNHLDALFLEDGDERFFVKEFTQGPATREFYDRIDPWLHGSGPAALFHYLLHLDLGEFNPREHAPLTAAKRNMILASKNDIGMWVQRLIDDPASCLRPLGAAVSEKCDLLTPTQLYRAFDPERRLRGSESALGRALGNAGFRHANNGTPVVTGSGTHRLYVVRNQVQWDQSTRKEIKMHYDEFFGPGAVGNIGGGVP